MKHSIIFLIVILSIHNIAQSNTAAPDACTIQGLAGTYPAMLGNIVLKDQLNTPLNRVLLCGPGGNGKSTIPGKVVDFHNGVIAEKNKLRIAAQKKAMEHVFVLKKITCGNILTSFQSSGVENIRRVFEECIPSLFDISKEKPKEPAATNEIPKDNTNQNCSTKTEQEKKKEKDDQDEAEALKKKTKFVIFIDEIDCLARKKDSKSHPEHENTKKELWTLLDLCKFRDDIFIMCATNCYEELDRNFIYRFGENVVEIGNPDFNNRVAIIEKYNPTIAPLSHEDIKDLAKKTEKCSRRKIEDILLSLKHLDKASQKSAIKRNLEVAQKAVNLEEAKKSDNANCAQSCDKVRTDLTGVGVGTGVGFAITQILPSTGVAGGTTSAAVTTATTVSGAATSGSTITITPLYLIAAKVGIILSGGVLGILGVGFLHDRLCSCNKKKPA